MTSSSKQTGSTGQAARVKSVRHFNRFYTKQIGILRRGLLRSPFSLTEVRMMYELASGECKTAGDLISKLDLDGGYVSRILRDFHKKGLVDRSRSRSDGRQNLLRLTKKGRKEFGTLNTRQNQEVRAMLKTLSLDQQHRLIDSMQSIQRLLAAEMDLPRVCMLRAHRAGDMGWVLERHAVLYSQEYGWGEKFEALVARIIAEFIGNFDWRRERCWIAEEDGQRIGCVFLVKQSETVSKLHLLLVEPEARGCGVGKRLVAECIKFARSAGYRKMTLRTNSVLHPARHIYQQFGFKLVEAKRHDVYGRGLIGERWELRL